MKIPAFSPLGLLDALGSLMPRFCLRYWVSPGLDGPPDFVSLSVTCSGTSFGHLQEAFRAGSLGNSLEDSHRAFLGADVVVRLVDFLPPPPSPPPPALAHSHSQPAGDAPRRRRVLGRWFTLLADGAVCCVGRAPETRELLFDGSITLLE
jgi:hypothetical protein